MHLRAGNDGARSIRVSGRLIGEPIGRYGPFVMNTDAELRQVFEDHRAGA